LFSLLVVEIKRKKRFGIKYKQYILLPIPFLQFNKKYEVV
jgi:hypothetical protein